MKSFSLIFAASMLYFSNSFAGSINTQVLVSNDLQKEEAIKITNLMTQSWLSAHIINEDAFGSGSESLGRPEDYSATPASQVLSTIGMFDLYFTEGLKKLMVNHEITMPHELTIVVGPSIRTTNSYFNQKVAGKTVEIEEGVRQLLEATLAGLNLKVDLLPPAPVRNADGLLSSNNTYYQRDITQAAVEKLQRMYDAVNAYESKKNLTPDEVVALAKDLVSPIGFVFDLKLDPGSKGYSAVRKVHYQFYLPGSAHNVVKYFEPNESTDHSSLSSIHMRGYRELGGEVPITRLDIYKDFTRPSRLNLQLSAGLIDQHYSQANSDDLIPMKFPEQSILFVKGSALMTANDITIDALTPRFAADLLKKISLAPIPIQVDLQSLQFNYDYSPETDAGSSKFVEPGNYAITFSPKGSQMIFHLYTKERTFDFGDNRSVTTLSESSFSPIYTWDSIKYQKRNGNNPNAVGEEYLLGLFAERFSAGDIASLMPKLEARANKAVGDAPAQFESQLKPILDLFQSVAK